MNLYYYSYEFRLEKCGVIKLCNKQIYYTYMYVTGVQTFNIGFLIR